MTKDNKFFQSSVWTTIDWMFVASVVTAWTLLLLNISSALSDDNLIYAIGELKTYDNTLFNGNVYMGEGVISPRFIVDIIFALIMKLNGGSWGGAALVWIYFGAIIQSIGVAHIAYRINKRYQLIISVIIVYALMYCGNYLAGFSLIALATTSIGPALAFSILSISFLVGENKNYNAAWIFAAASIICHIHEGFYCCAVIFIFAIADSLVQKRLLIKENRFVFIAVIALLCVTVPSFLTDNMELSNSEFVYIYSIFRHPHHLQPSTWGIDSIYKTFWIDASLFILSTVVFLVVKGKNINQKIFTALSLLIAWVMSLSIMYVFTEVRPIALVSTMFFSKSFKYVLLIGVIWIIEASFELREKDLLVSHYLLILYPFIMALFDLTQLLFVAVLIVFVIKIENLLCEQSKNIIPTKYKYISDVIFAALIICIKRESFGIGLGTVIGVLVSIKNRAGFSSGGILVLVLCAVAAIGISSKIKFKGYKLFSTFVVLCMIGVSLFGRLIINDGGLRLISGEYSLVSSMGGELYSFANEFKDATYTDEQFLADPDDTTGSGWFQVVSERNCYVINKVIPSSKVTLDDWYDRYLKVNSFSDRSADEIKNAMDEIGIKYLLVNSSLYEKYDAATEFEPFLSSESDSYRIYKVSK